MKALVLLVMIASACGGAPAKVDANDPLGLFTDSPPTSTDAWDRTRQCAERGDSLAREMAADAGNAPAAMTQVSDWTTHYNKRFGRCYVLVGFFNSNATSTNLLPMSFQRVFDAYERRSVAQFTSQRLEEAGEDIWCRQTDEDTRETSSPPCEDVGKYVHHLMSQ